MTRRVVFASRGRRWSVIVPLVITLKFKYMSGCLISFATYGIGEMKTINRPYFADNINIFAREIVHLLWSVSTML